MAKIFAVKKTRASGRNVGKVFNPVVKLVLENQPFLRILVSKHAELPVQVCQINKILYIFLSLFASQVLLHIIIFLHGDHSTECTQT